MDGTMKTAVFTGPKQVELRECRIPQVGEEDALVKIDACAICTWEQRVYNGVKKVEFPFIGGHEMVGRIVEMGSKVDRLHWAVGDKVAVGGMLACGNCYYCKTGNTQSCEHFDHSKHLPGLPERGMGGFSEYLLVPPRNLFKYSRISPEEASITEPVTCVLHSVETADIQFGDTVVVIGCGIMGLLHVLLSLKKGAVVVASDVNEKRLELAKKLGASYTVDPSKENLHDSVWKITDGIGAQVVFDTTPIAAVAEDAIKCAGQMGKVVLYSSFYPDKPVQFSPDWLHKGAVRILGTANSNERDFVRTVKMLSEGVISVKPFVSAVYDFEEIKAALDSAIQGDKFRVVLRMK